MQDVKLTYGIPDIEIACATGANVNPSIFVGHQLIVLFLPADERLAVQELDQYASYATMLSDSDAWLIAILENEDWSPKVLSHRQSLACDGDGVAWRAFQRLLCHNSKFKRESGAVYLFARGGGLQRMWSGIGHADEVIGELRLPGDR